MLKNSVRKQAPRSTVLALSAVAALGGVLVMATDASAGVFGGCGGFGGHGFGGGAVASRSIAGGFAGHAVAPSFNRSQSLAPSRLRARNVDHNVMPADHASTTASNHVRPLPATPAEPQVPAVLDPPKIPPHLIQPPFGSNHIPPPNSGPQPVKPSPVGPVAPPPLHVLPGKPLPTPPPPGLAQPINPPAPVNPTPVNSPSNYGRPDIGSAGSTIAVEAPAADAGLTGPTCNRILRNGCYLAMHKFSTPNGAELRCTMICE